MEKDWLAEADRQNQIQKVLQMNDKTEQFGLTLTQADAELLMETRRASLKEQQRVEFGEGILPKLIFTFCDSPYIHQDNYVESITRLQEIFYLYKNESMELFSDDELLEYMKDAFDGVCEGSFAYLEDTVLSEYARAVREDGRQFFGNHYLAWRYGRDE